MPDEEHVLGRHDVRKASKKSETVSPVLKRGLSGLLKIRNAESLLFLTKEC